MKYAIAAVVLALAALSARAEVAVDPSSDTGVNFIIMGIIIDGADPIGGREWQLFRPIPAHHVLNPDGFDREDGRPDIVRKPITDSPLATWAWNQESHHDIAISEWDGSVWTEAEFPFASPADELDPRIWAETGGALHLAWWVDGTVDQVLRAQRDSGSAVWTQPILVTAGHSGRRPSVAVVDGDVYVVYERIVEFPNRQQVVLAVPDGSAHTTIVLAETARMQPLDPVLHSVGNNVWVDWKDNATQFGRVERDDTGWGPVVRHPWLDPSWVGVEATRKSIENEVVNNP